MEFSGHFHAPATLPPGERTPGAHWITGWVGHRAGLDTVVKGKIFIIAPTGNWTPIVQAVV
jgi:hypothetical protein